jgi:hypothetical protein
LEEVRSNYSEDCTEAMDSHAASVVFDVEDHCADCFVEGVEDHLDCCEDPKLEDRALAKDSSERDECCCCTVVAKDQIIQSDLDLVKASSLNVLLTDIMPKACHQYADLKSPTCY